jgi:hypothetical protein
MDENLEFTSIKAFIENGGVDNKNMILFPYARNISYEDGTLSMSLDFFNGSTETEIGLKVKLSEDLVEIIDNLLYGED